MVSLEWYSRWFNLEGLEAALASELVAHLGLPPEALRLDAAASAISTVQLESEGGFFTLIQQGYATVSAQPWALVREILSARMHAAVNVHCPELTFVRADSVLWNGGGVLLPGGALTGKTWLARSLIGAGAVGWSSHYAVLDAAGDLLPYPARDYPGQGVPALAVVEVEYSPAGVWSVQPRSAGQAALSLIAHLDGVPGQVGEAMSRLGRLSAAAQVRWAGGRGAADQAAAHILAEIKPVLASP